MGFWDDFQDGFSKPFKYGYSKFEKADRVADRVADGAGNLADSLGNILQGNTVMYLAIGAVVVIVLPKVLDRVL